MARLVVTLALNETHRQVFGIVWVLLHLLDPRKDLGVVGWR